MTPELSCPSLEQLQQAVLGLLEHDATETVIEHLASCPECQRAAPDSPAGDLLLETLRAQSGVAGRLEEDREHIDRVVRRASQFVQVVLEATRNTSSPLEATSAHGGSVDESAPEGYDFLSPAQAPDELGRLSHYRVFRVLGEGGMGVVFEAEDTLLHRRVALKAMKPRLAAGADARKRFIREAQTAASVDHENIVTIHQVGDDRGVPFIAMPLLRGETLGDRLAREGSGFRVQPTTNKEKGNRKFPSRKTQAPRPSRQIQNPKSKIQNHSPWPTFCASAARRPPAWQPRTKTG